MMPDGKPIETQWLVGEDRFKREFAEKRIIFRQKKNGDWQVYKKYYELDGDGKTKPASLIERFPNTEAKGELKALFNVQEGRDNVFYTVKPVHLIKHLLEPFLAPFNICLDYYSGSGTTGHAVISLNREDKGKRKYLLVEMGDYFDTVLKPRIAKVIYSADWKDGKPTSPETGISQLVKVIRLESYEDTINNLQVAEQSAQGKVIAANSALREKYFLHYLLDMETQGSPSLLNIAAFTDPTAYTLNIKKPGSDAQERRAVDLVETFNWLLGLRVGKLHAPQVFAALFVKEADAELPGDARGRLALKGRLKAVAPSPPAPLPPAGEGSNAWWFRAVEGIAPSSGGREQRVLVVWRKLTGNLEQDNLVLEAYLREELKFDVRKARDVAPFDVVYVNGSHALPAMPLCEVRQLEEAFHRLMWDVQDV
jgi:adenine-specific DNA-methyltransferase